MSQLLATLSHGGIVLECTERLEAVMQETAEGVKGVIIKEGKFLVLLKPDGELDLPGGRVHHGEGLEDSLRREIVEETGLQVEVLAPIEQWAFKKSEKLLIKGVTYLCRYVGGEVQLSQEHVKYFWTEADISTSPLMTPPQRQRR